MQANIPSPSFLHTPALGGKETSINYNNPKIIEAGIKANIDTSKFRWIKKFFNRVWLLVVCSFIVGLCCAYVILVPPEIIKYMAITPLLFVFYNLHKRW